MMKNYFDGDWLLSKISVSNMEWEMGFDKD